MIQINIQSPFLDPKDFNHPTILNSHSLKLNCQKLVYIIYKYVCIDNTCKNSKLQGVQIFNRDHISYKNFPKMVFENSLNQLNF